MMRTGKVQKGNLLIWLGRSLIGLVFVINVQCALAFLAVPERYAPGFEIDGVIGSGMIRGMGLLFLMWNVPYAEAAFDPVRRRVSLFEAVTMQAIGFIGESLLLATFPPEHIVIQVTEGRFILFDGLGLLALLLAAWLTRSVQSP